MLRCLFGLSNKGTQKQHLTETNLSLEKVVEIASGAETADKNAQQLQGGEPLRVGKATPTSAPVQACYHCESQGHKDSNCRHKNTVCHNCGKEGHLSRVCCLAPQPAHQKSGHGRGRGHGSTRWVQVTAIQESAVADCIYAVEAQRNPPLQETLEVNGVEEPMEVDMGRLSLTDVTEDTTAAVSRAYLGEAHSAAYHIHSRTHLHCGEDGGAGEVPELL